MANKKKRILFIMTAMYIGGAERCLIGLLDALDYTKYDVDLFLFRREGELLPYIDERVNLLPEIPEYTIYARPLKNILKEGRFRLAAGRVRAKLKAKRFNKRNALTNSMAELVYSHKYTKKYLPRINPELTYDLAVSFITPHYIAAEKVSAKIKAAWIHTDYTKVGLDTEEELKMWSAMNFIISISGGVSEAFCSVFPSLSDKIRIIEHIMPVRMINRLAREDIRDEMNAEEDIVRLLSIGRFCYAKNFDNVPAICRILIDKGLNVKWYLIGFGGDEELIKTKIAEAGMQNNVIILGKKENPYPYILNCDFYLQPSRFEGKSITVCEALTLGKLTVIADYTTARSQIHDRIDGVILPTDNRSFAELLSEFIANSGLQKKIYDNIKNRDYSNCKEAEKLYALME